MNDEPEAAPELAEAIETGVRLMRSGDSLAALATFDAAIAAQPGLAVAHYNRGCALELLSRDAEALTTYRTALALLPELAEAGVRLAGLLLAQGEHDEALALLREAAEIAPDEPVGWLAAAKVRVEEGDAAGAVAGLRPALAEAPDNAELHQLNGVALRETGDFAAAEAALLRSLALEPAQSAAWHNLLTIRHVTPADRPLLERLDAQLRRPEFSDLHLAPLHFARGKAHDDLGEYGAAMGHFDIANSLRRHHLSFDRERFGADIDALIAAFPDGGSIDAAAETSDLPVFVLGMMRSGTTLVEQVLSSHPAIGGAGELPFWANVAARRATYGLRFSAFEAQATAADNLRILADHAPGRTRVVDKMPGNFLWIGLIRQALPKARIIHCRRNAVDTCLSIYFTDFGVRKNFAYDRGDLAFYWRQYARLMDHWRACLPAASFLEVDYEALVARPETEARRMIEFCGLEWDDACLHPENNPRVVRTASVWQARQPIYTRSVARWRNYAPWLGELAALHHETRAGGV